MTYCVNEDGLELIKRYEGCRLEVYRDAAGHPTVGFGHKVTGLEPFSFPITQDQAELLLDQDLQDIETAVERMFRIILNDNEFSALVSLAFNIGPGNLITSTLRALVNRSDFEGAADEFLRWNHVGGKVLAGLTARRKEERALFLKPIVNSLTDSD